MKLDSLLTGRTSSTSPDPVDWIQQHFYIPETNAPIQLIPYQQAVIREALRRDTNGLFEYSFILWSDIKKSAKSTIAGAMSLYLAWHHGYETARVVGNDLKQADSRTFFYIERAIKLNPVLAPQCKLKTYHIELPNQTTIDAIPVDPKGEAGGGDLVTAFTEMWAMKNKASQALWTETTLSPLKFGKSLRIGESYAGFKGESPILEPLYESGVTNGQRLDLSFEDDTGYHDLSDLEVYRNGRTLTLWNTKPRCPWQTPEYYAQESTMLIPAEMERIHGNKWGNSSNAFVPIQWWDACRVDEIAPLNGRSVIIGIDAARANDSFAVVVVTRRDGKVQVIECRIWTPPLGGQIDFDEIETELKRLFNVYNVVEVAYDPTDLTSMSQRLRALRHWREFTQGQPRLEADKLLYDLIQMRLIEHRGEPELREHVQNANSEPENEKIRIVKRTMSQKIDGCVALSMAASRAIYYNI